MATSAVCFMMSKAATLQVFQHSTIKCCGFLAPELRLDFALLYAPGFFLTGLDYFALLYAPGFFLTGLDYSNCLALNFFDHIVDLVFKCTS